MAMQDQEIEGFMGQDYYPICLPDAVLYILGQGGRLLYASDILALTQGWHLNDAVSLLAEALGDFPDEQRAFLEAVVSDILRDRNYFCVLRAGIESFIERVGHLVRVDVAGQRISGPNLLGYQFLDRAYAADAMRWRRHGDVVCLCTYPSLARLPRLLDAYRNFERPIFVNIKRDGHSVRYGITPAESAVVRFDDADDHVFMDQLSDWGVRVVEVTTNLV